MTERGIHKILLAGFFVSGGAALVYEVAWTRALSVTLGSTTFALSTILSTFMAGLALGAKIGGWVADRRKDLVFVVGAIELGIGIFGLLSVPVIYALPPVYMALYKASGGSLSWFFAGQVVLCAGVMLVPTTLMGATFPLVSRRLTTSIEDVGANVGRAYSYNTMGAIIGAAACGFVLIPVAGVKGAAMTAASLNILVGLAFVFAVKE